LTKPLLIVTVAPTRLGLSVSLTVRVEEMGTGDWSEGKGRSLVSMSASTGATLVVALVLTLRVMVPSGPVLAASRISTAAVVSVVLSAVGKKASPARAAFTVESDPVTDQVPVAAS